MNDRHLSQKIVQAGMPGPHDMSSLEAVAKPCPAGDCASTFDAVPHFALSDVSSYDWVLQRVLSTWKSMTDSSMMLSCFTNTYGRFGAEGAIACLPGSGIKRIELAIRSAGRASIFGDTPLLTEASTPDDARRVADRVHAAGLRFSSANITSGNPLDPGVLDITLKKLDVAHSLGVDLVVGGGGEVEFREDEPTLWRHLRQIGERAGELGIVYCCETHPGVCQNAAAMRSMIEQVDHPHIRLNFDTANVLYYNEGVDAVRELKEVVEFVRHVHLKDSRGRFKEWYFPALGAGGAVDFAACRDLLSSAGFTGPLSLELEGIEGETPLTLEQHHQRVVDSLAHLRRCGYLS